MWNVHTIVWIHNTKTRNRFRDENKGISLDYICSLHFLDWFFWRPFILQRTSSAKISLFWFTWSFTDGIFGPKRDKNGEWRRLRDGEIHILCRSLNVVMVIKSRRLRWPGHVGRMEQGRNAFTILTWKPTAKEGLGVDGRTILELRYE